VDIYSFKENIHSGGRQSGSKMRPLCLFLCMFAACSSGYGNLLAGFFEFINHPGLCEENRIFYI